MNSSNVERWSVHCSSPEDIVYSLARKWIKVAQARWGQWAVDGSDLDAAAYYGAAIALRDWNPNKGASLSTYANHIIWGYLKEEVRRVTRHRPEWIGDFITIEETDAGEVAIRRIEQQYIRKLVARLPDKERLIILKGVMENVPYHQLASILGVTPSRVTQLKRQAFGRLRSWITGEPYQRGSK